MWATCTCPASTNRWCHVHFASGIVWVKSSLGIYSKYRELCNCLTAEPSGENLEQCTYLRVFIGKSTPSFSRRDACLKELKLQDNPGNLESTCNKDNSEREHGEAEMTMHGKSSFEFLFYNLCQKLKSLLTYFTICYHATPFKEKKSIWKWENKSFIHY